MTIRQQLLLDISAFLGNRNVVSLRGPRGEAFIPLVFANKHQGLAVVRTDGDNILVRTRHKDVIRDVALSLMMKEDLINILDSLKRTAPEPGNKACVAYASILGIANGAIGGADHNRFSRVTVMGLLREPPMEVSPGDRIEVPSVVLRWAKEEDLHCCGFTVEDFEEAGIEIFYEPVDTGAPGISHFKLERIVDKYTVHLLTSDDPVTEIRREVTMGTRGEFLSVWERGGSLRRVLIRMAVLAHFMGRVVETWPGHREKVSESVVKAYYDKILLEFKMPKLGARKLVETGNMALSTKETMEVAAENGTTRDETMDFAQMIASFKNIKGVEMKCHTVEIPRSAHLEMKNIALVTDDWVYNVLLSRIVNFCQNISMLPAEEVTALIRSKFPSGEKFKKTTLYATPDFGVFVKLKALHYDVTIKEFVTAAVLSGSNVNSEIVNNQ